MKLTVKRMPVLVLICATFTGAAPALAGHDFLTEAEIEKVREAQAPSDRLKLYILFARQRIDQLDRLLSKDKKGRAAEARELLEDYAAIIDEIDTVTDDALKRGADAAEGATAVIGAEKRFLGQLQQIQNRNLADADYYGIALHEAIASTSDSIDESGNNATGRGAKLAAEDERQKKQAEATLAAEDRLGKPPETAKSGDAKSGDAQPGQSTTADASQTDDSKPRRKAPTLLRPGEKAVDQK